MRLDRPHSALSRTRLLVPLLLLLAMLACMPARAGSAVEIITHPERNQVTLDSNQLHAIFTMRLREWPDGMPMRVFVLADADPTHVQFCREVLGTYPYVLRGVWDRLVYTGTGLAPNVVGSEAEMRERVRTTPGAIGYARRIDAANPPNPLASKVSSARAP